MKNWVSRPVIFWMFVRSGIGSNRDLQPWGLAFQ